MSQALHLALVGFANSGKSTFFNALTGAKQQTGNWTGVTVATKQHHFSFNNEQVLLSDLPGISSLATRAEQSKDLSITQDFLKNNDIDCLINVVDATQLKRQLYLTTQLLELGLPVLLVINKSDRKEAQTVDINILAKELGCKVIIANSLAKDTLKQVEQALLELPPASERPKKLILSANIVNKLADKNSTEVLIDLECGSCNDQGACQQTNTDAISIMQARYEFIQQLLLDVKKDLPASKKAPAISLSDRLDHFILHPWLGVPIFLGMMYLLFMFAINVGSAFIDFFDILAGAIFVDYPQQFLSSYDLPQWLLTLIEGAGLGIQTVATFIPIIACLFIGLSILESSGYLARAAFVVDSAMQKIGLPGKAFVPLIVGFGCTVPAVMSARILDSERERITTIMMSPFMSCGARLPVYALFAAAFFPDSGQNLVFLLYLIGIAAALFTGFLLKHTVLMGKNSVNIMELPLYEIPKLSYLVHRVWQRTRSFILGAGKTIVLVVCVLNFFNSLGTDGQFGHQDSQESVLSKSAQVVTPLLAPMGIKEDNWQASVGIITGLFAKEALVATFNSLYTDTNAEPEALKSMAELWTDATDSIKENLLGIQADDPLGTDIGDVSNLHTAAEQQGVNEGTFTVMQAAFAGKIGAFSYLLFILLYTPCAAAMGAIKSEVGSRWAGFAALWSFSLAYLAATFTYQVATFATNPLSAGISITIVIAIFAAIYYWLKRFGKSILTIPTQVSYY
ncbi:ferrous iron transport protein B [Colwellia hornerae]|uniref:Ferrous iron transport protein B n=1 Tax=Colwellia hornerae TaxID=89402 RepID=A0A5C6Q589_9GAMM|nr:ferrous iron transport protein B [Colwellia hornerae]TWX48119.1 ferrous iron transport protein B [Colwellia hornerae]TWX55120.1 ferrous iron transport protein B [Colwellia hornerae]TWX64016.1 ferrous iron transport protein B [Colwellia hornerae]